MVSVRAIDGTGNVDMSPDSHTCTVDAPPDTSIQSGPSGVTASRDASFAFAADEPARFECRLDGSTFTGCSSPTSYSGLADGTHRFEVRAIDETGKTDPTPAERTWTVDTIPPETFIQSGPSGLVKSCTVSARLALPAANARRLGFEGAPRRAAHGRARNGPRVTGAVTAGAGGRPPIPAGAAPRAPRIEGDLGSPGPGIDRAAAAREPPGHPAALRAQPGPEPLLDSERRRPTHRPAGRGGRSSVGRAPGCGPGGRGFESRRSPSLPASAVRDAIGPRSNPPTSSSRISVRAVALTDGV
jgi:hypothetical protein